MTELMLCAICGQLFVLDEGPLPITRTKLHAGRPARFDGRMLVDPTAVHRCMLPRRRSN